MNIASVLQGLATFSWLIVVGIIVLAVVRASRARPLKNAVLLVILAVVFSAVLTTISAGLVFIQADQRGVVISAVAPKGYRDQTLQPGLRWVIPFAENVKTYSIARQTYTMSVAPKRSGSGRRLDPCPHPGWTGSQRGCIGDLFH